METTRVKIDIHVLGVEIPETLANEYEALRKERKLRQAVEKDLNELVSLRKKVERMALDMIVVQADLDHAEKQLEIEKKLRGELISGMRN